MDDTSVQAKVDNSNNIEEVLQALRAKQHRSQTYIRLDDYLKTNLGNCTICKIRYPLMATVFKPLKRCDICEYIVCRDCGIDEAPNKRICHKCYKLREIKKLSTCTGPQYIDFKEDETFDLERDDCVITRTHKESESINENYFELEDVDNQDKKGSFVENVSENACESQLALKI